MSNYQIYGGIAEEEFVDVQDQDFVDAHFGVVDNAGGHFGTTIGTTDVQYSKNAQGEIVGHNAGEDGAGQPPAESEYYDENVGIDDAGGEAYLVEEVKQMVLEADEAEQQKEGEDGPEWVKEDGGASELEGNGQQQENMPNEQMETPQLLEQPQMELEQQQNEVAPDSIEEIARGNDAEEDPPTPTATTPKANNSCCQLSEIMAVETQYPVPYRSKLTEPFEPGQTLIVKGKTAEDSVRFTINLHHASADFSGNDVPIHISVRFDEGKMVFNTYSKGEWGKEERKSNPYKKGDDIDIRIRAHDSKFTIFADQKEIKEYEHRVPLSSISHFSIDGDVLITHIHWGGKYYPVPYESGITGDGFNPGKTMLIFGTPEKKGKRFHINLLKKNGDIALHFNPRFDEKAIVRNSLIANEWGNEEREGKNPLEKGIGFDLKIINEEYAFQIFINDDRFCSYAHRMEPHDIHGLQIGGDVEITGIQIF